jgi:dihydroneopterin aldolase
MGIIEIEDMEFYAYHGCFEAEKVVGNYFLVQAKLETDCSIPAKTDAIADALNYQTAYDIIKEQMEIPSSLLEHVTTRILDALFIKFQNKLLSAQIKVSKIAPPMGGKMKAVSVTLQRKKN